MGKKALCVKKADVSIDAELMDLQSIPSGFHDIEAKLHDRDACETDESLLQLIPYIVVYDGHGRIFCYERGGGGGEGRLHGKLSIGIGGHVEEEPIDSENAVLELKDVLLDAAGRELSEELGVDGRPSHFMGLIYAGATKQPVDQVHLGLLTHVTVGSSTRSAEPEIVKDGKFVTLTELLQPDTFERLEVWSQIVVTRMSQMLSETLGSLLRAVAGITHRLNISSPTGATSSAGQEIGSILYSVAHNLEAGHAVARIYDVEDTLPLIGEAADAVREVERMLGEA